MLITRYAEEAIILPSQQTGSVKMANIYMYMWGGGLYPDAQHVIHVIAPPPPPRKNFQSISAISGLKMPYFYFTITLWFNLKQ
jgi:hypothetical protein